MNATQNASVGSAVSGINYHDKIATKGLNPTGLALVGGLLDQAIEVLRLMGCTPQGQSVNFGGEVMDRLQDFANMAHQRSIDLRTEKVYAEMASEMDAVAKAADAAAQKAQAAAKAEATPTPAPAPKAEKAKKSDPAPKAAPAAPAVKTPAQMAMGLSKGDFAKASTRDWGKDSRKDAIYIANLKSVYFTPTTTDDEVIDAIDAEIERREKATKAETKAPAPKAKAAPTVALPDSWAAVVKMSATELEAAAKVLKVELVKNSMKNKSIIWKAIQASK